MGATLAGASHHTISVMLCRNRIRGARSGYCTLCRRFVWRLRREIMASAFRTVVAMALVHRLNERIERLCAVRE